MSPAASALIQDVTTQDGQVSPDRLAHHLQIDIEQLAAAAGLPSDSFSTTTGIIAASSQGRLRDVLDILSRVVEWAGSGPAAIVWYHSRPLEGFGNQTAADLVKAGRSEAVRHHISALERGGYA
jgi:uncharacterized protein (DUF2384 family)